MGHAGKADRCGDYIFDDSGHSTSPPALTQAGWVECWACPLLADFAAEVGGQRSEAPDAIS